MSVVGSYLPEEEPWLRVGLPSPRSHLPPTADLRLRPFKRGVMGKQGEQVPEGKRGLPSLPSQVT